MSEAAPSHRPREVAIVIRFTAYEGVEVPDCVQLMSMYDDVADADAEASRLNSVRASDNAQYFVKLLALKPGKGDGVLDQ